jgi:hypothetical protein
MAGALIVALPTNFFFFYAVYYLATTLPEDGARVTTWDAFFYGIIRGFGVIFLVVDGTIACVASMCLFHSCKEARDVERRQRPALVLSPSFSKAPRRSATVVDSG